MKTLTTNSKMHLAYLALHTADAAKGGSTVQALADRLGITVTAGASLIGDLRRKGLAIAKRRDGAGWVMYTLDVAPVEAPAPAAGKAKAKAPAAGKAPAKAKAKAPAAGKAPAKAKAPAAPAAA